MNKTHDGRELTSLLGREEIVRVRITFPFLCSPGGSLAQRRWCRAINAQREADRPLIEANLQAEDYGKRFIPHSSFVKAYTVEIRGRVTCTMKGVGFLIEATLCCGRAGRRGQNILASSV
jgi:hypothetical protein